MPGALRDDASVPGVVHAAEGTAQYETLRARVLGEPLGSARPASGLVVLYRWGLPRWLAHLRHVAPRRAEGSASAPGRFSPELPAPEAPTILILASMVLAAGEEP